MKYKRDIFADLNEETNLTSDEKSLLFLVPLIQMAWVCSAVSPREKHIIFLAARNDEIDERHDYNDVIDEWLKIQPSQIFYDKCLSHIGYLLRSMTVVEREKLKATIIDRCEKVALAAGSKSLMDVDHRISLAEEELLSEIKEVLS